MSVKLISYISLFPLFYNGVSAKIAFRLDGEPRT